MTYTEEKIEEIKTMADIVSVVSDYVQLTDFYTKNSIKVNYIGQCPFHKGKQHTFCVYPENNSYFCFGCGKEGDVIDFIERIEGLSYSDAVKTLAKRCGVEPPDVPESKCKDTIYRMNVMATRMFENRLHSPNGKEALDYLVGRGISIETIKDLHLGVASGDPTDLFYYLLSLGFDIPDMIESGLVYTQYGRYYDRFAGRIIFPIFDTDNNVIAFVGRKYSEKTKANAEIFPIYINSIDTPVYVKASALYGLEHAKNHSGDKLFIVEGVMDAVMLYDKGIKNAVAVLGTNLTDKQADVISRYADEAVILFDSDTPGQKGAEIAAEKLRRKYIGVKRTTLPECNDPAEYLCKYGVERFREMLAGSTAAFKTIYEEICEDCYGFVTEKYGENPPGAILERLRRELYAPAFDSNTEGIREAKELADKCKVNGIPYKTLGPTGASFVCYCLGISKLNPLPAHYYCPVCKKVEWADGIYTGYDLQAKKCVCGHEKECDGFNLAVEPLIGLKGNKIPSVEISAVEDGLSAYPELSGETAKLIAEYVKPKTYHQYIKIAGILLAKGSWEYPIERLLKNGICTLEEIPLCFDDIYSDLLRHGMTIDKAFRYAESVRKTQNKKERWSLEFKKEFYNDLKSAGMPDWYYECCESMPQLPKKAEMCEYAIAAIEGIRQNDKACDE